MIDYRGYGLSEGKPSLPEVYEDIAAAMSWLERAPEVQGKPLVLLGQSLGGAMAIHYLAGHPEQRQRFSALVFDGVPASYRSVGRYAERLLTHDAAFKVVDALRLRLWRAIAARGTGSRRQARTAAPAPTRKRLNPLAAIPYGIAVILFALEALLYV